MTSTARPDGAATVARAARYALRARVAVVTGASRGIGLAIAQDMAAAGAEIVMVDRNPDVEQGAEDLRGQGLKAWSATCDVTREDEISHLFATIQDRSGGLDILVNNAAILLARSAAKTSRVEWQRVIDTNLTASFFMAQAAAAAMTGRGGAIVNLSSIVGRTARIKLAAYIAAKAGIDGLTRSLACDLAGTGIRVNAVAPGFVATEMSRTGDPSFERWVQQTVPARRWGRPEDIAGVVSFLASEAASYVNGQTIYVDGGFTAVSA